jgi:flagellar biosynthesis protein FlhG
MGGIMASDQAKTLRDLRDQAEARRRAHREAPHQARVVAVTSGKGGVGKTNVVASLAVELSRRGRKVLVLDADLGLANVDILLGLAPNGHLGDVISGVCDIEDIVLEGPEGVALLPAASGIAEVTSLSEAQKGRLRVALNRLRETYDTLLVDTGAGISSNVIYFAGSAQEVVVVVTPEPTALADAYAVIKVLRNRRRIRRVQLLVNQVHHVSDAEAVHERLVRVSERFLDVDIQLLGHIYSDPAVHRAVMEQRPIALAYPGSPAARCLNQLAQRIDMLADAPDNPGDVSRFWDRLLAGDEGV